VTVAITRAAHLVHHDLKHGAILNQLAPACTSGQSTLTTG
jgi:hypothetical protein